MIKTLLLWGKRFFIAGFFLNAIFWIIAPTVMKIDISLTESIIGLLLSAVQFAFLAGIFGICFGLMSYFLGSSKSALGLIVLNILMFVGIYWYLARNGFGAGPGGAILIVWFFFESMAAVLLFDLLAFLAIKINRYIRNKKPAV